MIPPDIQKGPSVNGSDNEKGEQCYSDDPRRRVQLVSNERREHRAAEEANYHPIAQPSS
jgi:hypothetical protein